MNERKKVLTIHVKGLRLTPSLVAVLAAAATELGDPYLHTTQDGLVLSVPTWL